MNDERANLTNHEERYIDATREKETMVLQLKKIESELLEHEQKLLVLKYKARHPFLMAFRAIFYDIEVLADLCASYLPEIFCVKCEVLHLDSQCLSCSNHSSYRIQDDMVLAHTHDLNMKWETVSRGTLFCFAPKHMDDIRLVQDWNSKIVKVFHSKGFEEKYEEPSLNYIFCPMNSRDTTLLSSIFSTMVDYKNNPAKIVKGTKIMIEFNCSYHLVHELSFHLGKIQLQRNPINY